MNAATIVGIVGIVVTALIAIISGLGAMLVRALNRINTRIDDHLTAEDKVFEDMRDEMGKMAKAHADTREDVAFIAGTLGMATGRQRLAPPPLLPTRTEQHPG